MLSYDVKPLRSVPSVVVIVFIAKSIRTFCYGFLGITVPLYLADLGMSARGVGVSVTLMLVGSALLTWVIRRPAERFGARPALIGITALTAVSAGLLLWTRSPWGVVIAAMLGNVAVGTGETGPFLTVEQVVVARAVPPSTRTSALSVYNLIGYASAALGAAAVGIAPSPTWLFGAFLAGAGVQLAVYARLSIARPPARASSPAAARLPSARIIRQLAALFALDSFAGGFVLQSLVAYFLHVRFGLTLDRLGLVFALTQVCTAASLVLAPACARRFGLLPTMVVSHLISNVFLIAIAAAPAAAAAIALLLGRHLLSQMDVPTRQAYVMAVVADHEREAAASLTNLSRTVAQAVTPALTGWVMQAVALSAPFALGGALKIVYDVLLWWTFREVTLRE
jgi:MFS family permease